MASVLRSTVETYIRAWGERDPSLRAQLIEQCFAVDGRIVTRSREIRGRQAFADAAARLHADPLFERIRVTSALDAQGTTFRVRAVAERGDGTAPEAFDAGQVDANGQICLVLTFAGPLRDSDE